MAHDFKKTLLATGLGVALMAGAASPAFATEGYFQNGFGARNKAMAGAGVADTKDAADQIVNPAGLFDIGNEAQISITAFNPQRYVKATGQGFVPNGTTESGVNWYPVPNLAFSRVVNDRFAYGMAMFGNGGMNTSYPYDTINPACAMPGMPSQSGVFCGGKAGVDLTQVFLQASFAYRPVDNFTIGVSPLLAFQRFKARGIYVFGGFSADPAALTNNGSDSSSGIGVRVGAKWDVAKDFHIAGSYQPKIIMDRFDLYRGLFADGGKFDIPSNWQVGVTWDATDHLSASFDVRRINYSDVPSVSNSSTVMNYLGNFGGPGFGWNDVTTYKIGVEWRGEKWTYRAGFSHNNNPISSGDVTFNIFAPGTIENHVSAGVGYKISKHQSIDASLTYAPTAKTQGIEITPLGANPNNPIEIGMKQWEYTIGYNWKF